MRKSRPESPALAKPVRLSALFAVFALGVTSVIAGAGCRTREYNSGASAKGLFGPRTPEEAGWKGAPSVRVGACHGTQNVGGKQLHFLIQNFDGNYSSVLRLEIVEGSLATVTDSTPKETLTLSGSGLFVVVPGFGGKGGGSYRYSSEYLGNERLGDGTSLKHLESHMAWYEKNPGEKKGDVYESRLRQVRSLRAAHAEQLAQRSAAGVMIPVLGTPSRASEFDILADYMPDANQTGNGGDGDITVKWAMKGSGHSFQVQLHCESLLSKSNDASLLDKVPGAVTDFVKFILERQGNSR